MSLTIETSFRLDGVSLHGGRHVRAEVRPSNTPGIRFHVPGGIVEARSSAVVRGAERTTMLRAGQAQVSTVEHLMAAAWCAGMDTLDVVLDDDELPVLDGSARAWLIGLLTAGERTLQSGSPAFHLAREVRVRGANGAWAIARPWPSLRLTVQTDFANPGIGRGTMVVAGPWAREWACRELAGARTFVEEETVTLLRARGMALGGSLESALVFRTDGSVANPGGRRWPDEPLRHKTLDALGDLMMLSNDLRADVRMHAPGHSMTAELCAAMMDARTLNSRAA